MAKKIKLKRKNRSHRYNTNRPRLKHRHKHTKCKIYLSIIMVICIKQHLSNILFNKWRYDIYYIAQRVFINSTCFFELFIVPISAHIVP